MHTGIGPIVERVAQLSDQWARFAALPDARVLCWRMTGEELKLFDAFLTMESDERTADHTALFLSFETPCSATRDHGRHLSQALLEGCAECADELRALDLPTNFQPGEPRQAELDVAQLVRVCGGFLEYYGVAGPLVLVLRPREVADVAAYCRWLLAFATAAPTSLRVIVVDTLEEPAYAQLVAADTRRIVAIDAALNVPRALEELSDQAGGTNTPGGQFRALFVRLGSALQAKDLERALRLGAAAVEVATGHALWHLAVPVHVALAAALLAQGRGPDGLAQYAAAESAAQRGLMHEAGSTRDVCQQLHLQARLAHGAGLISLRKWPEAANLYEDAATLTQAMPEPELAIVLDCHRLVSFCHEQQGQHERAWQSGLRGLSVAHELSEQARAMSSLPYLVDALERLIAHLPLAAAEQLARELRQLRPA